MSEKPYNGNRLSERFHNAIGNSRDARIEDNYDLDPADAERIAEQADCLAEVLIKGAKDVVSHTTVAKAQAELEHLFRRPEDDRLRDFVIRVVDEEIGDEIVRMQTAAEERFVLLILMGKEAFTDEKTRNYLRLATQCFLFGLDEQCAVMCRSALEAGFMAVAPGAGKLAARISDAKKTGKLDCGLAEAAYYVNDKANDVIHPDRKKHSDIAPDEARKILFYTINVTQALMDKAAPEAKPK